jgi:hypothetical protein
LITDTHALLLTPYLLQVLDVAVLGLAGRMLAPAWAAHLGPSRFWWLAAWLFGFVPSAMGLTWDWLVAGMAAGQAGAAGGGSVKCCNVVAAAGGGGQQGCAWCSAAFG